MKASNGQGRGKEHGTVVLQAHRTDGVQIAPSEDFVLPSLTSLQFEILGVLSFASWSSGETVRDGLALVQLHKSLPSFYQAMSRLEKIKVIVGRPQEGRTESGRKISERHYKLTDLGKKAFENEYERAESRVARFQSVVRVAT